MSSTFFGLTISASGLNAAQAQINTTANNISNVNTEGYSKQVVNTVASSALRCYQSYGTTGTGVEAVSVTQARDLYYDEKYWNNQANLGYYEKKYYYMDQVETYFSEVEAQTGFSTIYSKMYNAMSTLQTSPGDETVRKQFISDAVELTEYFNTMSSNLKNLQSSINDEIKSTVDNINAIAEKVAILNKQINVIEQGGGTANELRDQRALLIDELSSIVTTETKEYEVKSTNDPDMDTGATRYIVYINGQTLVDTYEYNTLAVKSREDDETSNQCDVEGLYDVVWEKDGNDFNPVNNSNSGSLKALFEVRDGNNNENLKGTVSAATDKTITITNLSNEDLNELCMDSSGSIYVNSKEYTYQSFSFETDSDGNVVSMTFNLSDDITLSASDASSLISRKLTCGKSVDFMGIPYYQNQMSVFLRNFCEMFNTIEESGVDLNGDAMGAFFIAEDTVADEEHGMSDELIDYEKDADGNYVLDADGNKIKTGNNLTHTSDSETYYRLTAEDINVAYASRKDAAIFATTTAENYSSGVDAADLIVELQKLQSETNIFRGGGGDSFLQCIYADVTVDTQECSIFVDNYTNIQETIESQRMSVSGVDEDEEALDLVKFQNAYNLASKCISVFTEIYDRLILETGV